MGNGGEIFVFDMGKPVRIIDLAKRVDSAFGRQERRGSGLRVFVPGEKLYEEVLNDEEITPAYLPSEDQDRQGTGVRL